MRNRDKLKWTFRALLSTVVLIAPAQADHHGKPPPQDITATCSLVRCYYTSCDSSPSGSTARFRVVLTDGLDDLVLATMLFMAP
jgi:hypothetical protein